jgi:hypothetical protein
MRHPAFQVSRPSFSTAGLGFLLCIFLAGCSETKFIPPSSEMRQSLGRIAAISMPSHSTSSVDKPVSGAGSGALVGAGEAAVGGLAIGANGCRAGPYGCIGLVLGAAIAVVAAPIGAVVGAINAHSEEEVRTADASLRGALADVKAGEQLIVRVVADAKARTPYDLSFPQLGATIASAHQLTASGFASTLEVAITDLRLNSAGKINPDLTLTIVAEARLKRAADGSPIYRRVWAYIGVSKNYFRMASGQAAMLRAEISTGLDALADRIVTDLFISNSPERQETSPRPGTVLTIEAPKLQKPPVLQNSPAPPSGWPIKPGS